MRKLTLLLLVFVLVIGASAVTAQDAELGPVTQQIIDRGYLICGVNQNLTGFGYINDAGEFEGFDVEFCRAVAVAILGDPTAVTFLPLTGAERQAAIQGGSIDMMARNTTWTLSRDVTWGAIFGPTTFYDGQGFGARADLGITSAFELDGASVCVQTGTTTELNLADFISANGLDVESKIFPDAPSTWEAYLSGGCEAWTTDISGIAAYHADSENPGDHVILVETISKEPLGPLSPQSDPQFAEIVAWTAFGMMEAEEQGITSENVDDFLGSDNPVIQRLLGQNNNDSGNYLGLDNDFMVNVIREIGNYGEVYERNLGPLGIQRGVNALWTDGGLIYNPPFR